MPLERDRQTCFRCDETFVVRLAGLVRSRLHHTVDDISEAVLLERIRLGINRAILRGLRSERATILFVLLMFALEPEFDRRRRVCEYLASRDESLEASLLSMDVDSHPNCWYRVEPSVAERQWRVLTVQPEPHVHCSLVDSGDCSLEPRLPRQLSPEYGFQLDVPYLQTPGDVVHSMLAMARVGPSDTVIDLGSGDGRIVITAAAVFGARGIGIDLNPENITVGRGAASRAGVSDRVAFICCDFFDANLSPATVVTMYLLRDVNLQLRDRLRQQLRAGSRIVSRHFDMGDWPADIQSGDLSDRIYCWSIPPQAGA